MSIGRALIEHPTRVNRLLVQRATVGLLALLCGNAYIVGINQIYDEKIDQVRTM
jgi:homogentisate solanesyltransferase